MKTHFFQRYHGKENADTANAMLLLSRLYSFSPPKFYSFLEKILPENATVELSIQLQEKSEYSVLDAVIAQSSFKIAIETKLHGDFGVEQLKNHLYAFHDETYKVLLTLDPNPMSKKIVSELVKAINSHNAEKKSNIIHRHLTFEELSDFILEILDERDYEMQGIVEDYKDYCYESKLIRNDKMRMRVQLAGTTISINRQLNLYYDNAERRFSGHQYLGLYNQKAVRAVGEIIAIATALPDSNGELVITCEMGEIIPEMREKIKIAIADARTHGYDLESVRHRYFFVKEFCETFYEKETSRAPMGSRVFDLSEVLGVKKLPDVKQIAELLRTKTWQ